MAAAATAMPMVKGAATIDRVVFALNGQRYEVGGVDRSTRLLEFIRTQTPFKGPKLGCGDGGCGACVVLIAKYNPKTDEVTEFIASSCLTLLYTINFCSVITTEGLGNSQDGFHTVQERMSGFHASQCGFCTPGMCMSIFTSLINADKSKRHEPPKGFSKLKVSEAKKAFSGNLCRCTGYRPIVDACKSFASDVDLEDLGLNIFWKKGDRLVSTSSYLDRVESIKEFNSNNKWRKRGISCVPLIFKVEPRAAPGRVSVLNDGSIVVEVGGIEIGQGLWTKVQQMTAFALGKLWPDGGESLLERVHVLQADTLNLIQGGLTAESTSSESSCAATLQACNMLLDRLKPILDRLRQQSENVSWDTLISQASKDNVNLSASAYWVPGQVSNKYLNYGAGISEVEIDLLTGAITLIRGDLVYDCGKNLNPAVDLGQIEGSFIQGIGFFFYEEYITNSDGLMISNSTWDYKIPSVDIIPKQFHAEVLNTGYHKNRVLSSKASGEPALVLASSVHCALREAIRAARVEFANGTVSGRSPLEFQMDVPAPMTLVKELCGLDSVEKYLECLSTYELSAGA